jgi:hypothetical protein
MARGSSLGELGPRGGLKWSSRKPRAELAAGWQPWEELATAAAWRRGGARDGLAAWWSSGRRLLAEEARGDTVEGSAQSVLEDGSAPEVAAARVDEEGGRDRDVPGSGELGLPTGENNVWGSD